MKKLRFLFAVSVILLFMTNAYARESFSERLNNIVKIPQGAIKDISTKENFRQRASQMGDEMKIVHDFTPDGKTKIFVSADGDNAKGDGSIEKPYRDIQFALDKFSAMSYNEKLGGAVIYIREGNYSIPKTIELNARHSGVDDAPLYITSYNNESVNLSSASMIPLSDFKQITDNQQHSRLYEKVRDKVLVYDLKAHGITDYGRVYFVGEKTGKYSDLYESMTYKEPQLYVGDEKCTLSRYPNGEMIRVGEAIDNGNIDETGCITNASDDGRGYEFVMLDDVPFKWKNTGEIALRGFFSFGYAPEYGRVKQFNKETNSVRSVGKLWRWPIRQTNETMYYFANVFEELDAPGEWFLDREDGKLYLYPPSEDMSKLVYLSIKENDIFDANSCKNVVFNGLNIENSPAYGFALNNCERVVVQNCNLKGLATGVVIDSCKYTGVISSYISGFSTRGVKMQNSNEEFWDFAQKNMDLKPCHNFIQNNYFCQSDDATATKTIEVGGVGIVVSHNLFQNGYKGTISPSGMYAVTEYNEIVGGDKRVSDFAPMYTGGVYASYLVTRYNYIHDNSIYGNKLGRGLYFDEGGSWFECYGNLLVEQEEGIYSHSGKNGVAYNNVFINCRSNVVTSGNHIGHLYDWIRNQNYASTSFWSGWFSNLNRKGYYDLYRAPYSVQFPEQQELTDYFWRYQHWFYNDMKDKMSDPIQEDELWLLTPSEYYIANNFALGSEFEKSISELSLPTSEIENNVMLTEDSFADFKNKDYRITDKEALAKNPDFVQIPIDKIGLLSNTRWDNIQLGEIEMRQPLDGYENRVNAAKILFDWKQVEFAEDYRIVIAKDKEFENIIYEETVDTSGAVVTLNEFDCELYYKVIAESRSKQLKYAEKESDVFSFWTYSRDEANAVAKADKSALVTALTSASKLADSITDDRYPAGTKEDLQKYIDNTQIYREETNIQTYIDEKTDEVYEKIWEVQKKAKIGIMPLNTDKSNWKKLDTSALGGVASPATFENDSSGALIYNSKSDSGARLGSVDSIPFGTLVSFRYNAESYGGWQPLGFQYENQDMGLGMDSYYFVIKDDIIELQKYGKFPKYIIAEAPNNSAMPKGKWNDIVMGTVPSDEGTRVILISNGKVIFDYLDKHEDGNYCMESYIYEGLNETEKTASFAPYEITLDEVMSILKSGGIK